jgi:hypothetical protein
MLGSKVIQLDKKMSPFTSKRLTGYTLSKSRKIKKRKGNPRTVVAVLIVANNSQNYNKRQLKSSLKKFLRECL